MPKQKLSDYLMSLPALKRDKVENPPEWLGNVQVSILHRIESKHVTLGVEQDEDIFILSYKAASDAEIDLVSMFSLFTMVTACIASTKAICIDAEFETHKLAIIIDLS